MKNEMKPTEDTVIVDFNPNRPYEYCAYQYKLLGERQRNAVYWNDKLQCFQVDLNKV